jgi:voltage-gated potassium channel
MSQRMTPVTRRFAIAVTLLVGVFVYGTIGHYVLLQSEFSLLRCAYRTVVLLSTINEAFDREELGPLYTRTYLVFMLSLVVFGIGVILYALSTITAFLVEGDLQHLWRLRKMSNEISKQKNHIIICGGGETGHYIADELRVSRHPFVMIDKDHERAGRLDAEGILFVEGDAMEEETLELAGIMRADALAVCLPGDQENLFVTITARQMNPALTIIAKGVDVNIGKKLLAAGADRVVRPAFIGGLRMANELIRPTAVSFMDRMLTDPEETTRLEEIAINQDCGLEGLTIGEANFRQKTGLQVVAVKLPEEQRYCYQPDSTTVLRAGTVLIVLGTTDDVAKARAMAGMG